MTKPKTPLSGDITVKRKADKIQIVREPKVVLCTLTAEEGLALASGITSQADVILKATGGEED